MLARVRRAHGRGVLAGLQPRRGHGVGVGGADETVKVWDVSQSASAEVNGGEAGAAAGESKAATAARKPPMTSLRTKSTPVFNVQFTGRNLLMAMGARAPSVRSQVA